MTAFHLRRVQSLGAEVPTNALSPNESFHRENHKLAHIDSGHSALHHHATDEQRVLRQARTVYGSPTAVAIRGRARYLCHTPLAGAVFPQDTEGVGVMFSTTALIIRCRCSVLHWRRRHVRCTVPLVLAQNSLQAQAP